MELLKEHKYENIIPAPRLQLGHRGEEISIPSFPESIGIYLDTYQDGDFSFSGQHWHKSFQFNVILEGNLDVMVNDRELHLTEGEGIFINSDVLHCLNPRGDSNCICYSFQIPSSALCSEKDVPLYRKYIRPIARCQGFGCVMLEQKDVWGSRILECLNQAFAVALRREFAYELKIKNLLLEAWLILLERFEEVAKPSSDPAVSLAVERVKKMLSYIGENYCKKITLEEIAASASVSLSECNRCFRKFLDTTPMDYVTRERIAQACRLFEEKDMKLTVVGEMVGFLDYSYFHRVFKKHMGCTPKEYQMRVRETSAGEK